MNTDKLAARSRFGSFKFAFHGLSSLIKNEHNARIHLIAALIAVIVGIILKISLTEWCILTIVIGLVFITELLNTSLENLADIVDPEWNAAIRKTKNYAAAAVLISAIVSVVVGALIFIPRLLEIL
jgi:diacylglycerol kinase